MGDGKVRHCFGVSVTSREWVTSWPRYAVKCPGGGAGGWQGATAEVFSAEAANPPRGPRAGWWEQVGTAWPFLGPGVLSNNHREDQELRSRGAKRWVLGCWQVMGCWLWF